MIGIILYSRQVDPVPWQLHIMDAGSTRNFSIIHTHVSGHLDKFKRGCQVLSFFLKAILNNLRKGRNYILKTNCSFVRLTVFVDCGLLVFLFTDRDHVPRLILAGFKCNLYITLNLKNKFLYYFIWFFQ